MIEPAPSYGRCAELLASKQALWPNKPTFLPEEYPDLSNKIAIVTGANTGIGFCVAKLLYEKNCNVVAVVRTESKGLEASAKIKEEVPSSKGSITVVSGCHFLDLTTVKRVGEEINNILGNKPLSIIIHNAGLMAPNNAGTSKQGYEAMFSVNALGPQLLQHFLDPLFLKKDDPLKRIVWVSSLAHYSGFKEYGINWENPTFEKVPIEERPGSQTLYGQSKAANILQAKAWASKHKDIVDNIGCVSVSCFPGILRTELLRDWGYVVDFISSHFFYGAVYGAYSELYAALYPKLTIKDQGAYICPFGEIREPRKDISVGLGNGADLKLWDFIQDKISPFF
ncbi:hypothetical protein BZL39_H04970 [Zygosaccharomyces parabailii]|nr:hypothetical protein BZL39_H04970 [Zygosaccharomyces parabailii]